MYTAMMQDNYVWLFSRYIGSNGKQLVPGQGASSLQPGLLHPESQQLTNATPIHQPITDNSVVRELLKRSEVATAEVGAEYVRYWGLFESSTHRMAMAR